MIMHYRILLFLSLINFSAYAQVDSCGLLRSINSDFFEKKCKTTYFLDSATSIRFLEKSSVEALLFPALDKSSIDSIYSLIKREAEYKQKLWSCASGNINSISNKQIGHILKENDDLIVDSTKERKIAQRINEILKLEVISMRDSIYNEYMRTQEVVEIRAKRDYNTKRIIELTRPIYFRNYAFVMILVRTGTRESTDLFALYKASDQNWQLIKSGSSSFPRRMASY